MNTSSKVALLETGTVTEKSINAHVKLSYLLRDNFGWDLVSREKYKNYLNNKYDKLIVVYACRYAPIKIIKYLVDNNTSAKLFWITNEYNLPINSSLEYLNRGGYHIISNFEKSKKFKFGNDYSFLNLNVLMFKKPNELKLDQKKYDLIYYGTFRPGRGKYFIKYLDNNIYLSTSIKNFKKFKYMINGKCPKWIKSLSWENGRETLNNFRFSLYIEDEYTHKVYNNLANRFYEALFCNCITMFDSNCRNTIERSGIDLDEIFIVKNRNELRNKIKLIRNDFTSYLKIQQKYTDQFLNERENVLKEIKNIIEK